MVELHRSSVKSLYGGYRKTRIALSQPRLSTQWLKYNFLMLLLCFSVACSLHTQPKFHMQALYPRLKATLPGQQIWKQGASSFLFGTNDSTEWSSHNLQNDPAIQKALRRAGFTLLRTFFPDNASDAVIEKRIQTIENSGASCLGVIPNIFNVAFAEHLVSYLGKRCQMYEFGNESDYKGISIADYLSQWNRMIPVLRQIHPGATFIGPVTYNDQGRQNFMRAFLVGVKASGVLPDAISFHWYPCWHDTRASCLDKASSYSRVTLEVRQLVLQTLNKDLPIGITEWNYDPENPPLVYGDDPDFIVKFTTDALHLMIQSGVSFACQFDAASYSGYGHLDMFDIKNDQPKMQYYAITDLIKIYRS